MYLSRKREIINLVITYDPLIIIHIWTRNVIIYKLFVIKQLGKKKQQLQINDNFIDFVVKCRLAWESMIARE